jgi:hypothetical protein
LGAGSGGFFAAGWLVVFGLRAVVNFSSVADLGGDLGFVTRTGGGLPLAIGALGWRASAGGGLCLMVLAVLSPLVLPPMSEPHSSPEKQIIRGGTKHLAPRRPSQRGFAQLWD